MKTKPVFVLERPGAPPLAFEAQGWNEAVALAQSIWFNEFAGSSSGLNGPPCSVQGDYRVRFATGTEVGIYRQLCEEFDGPGRQLLVANLAGFTQESV